MISEEKPLVSICCITFNHAKYIRQCIESFLAQKTSFRYEIIVHDDCSTDGTTEILKEYERKYPNIFKIVYEEENMFSKGVRGFFLKYTIPLAEGKYIALCEGDDYWNDPKKLEKTVSFLEKNESYYACMHQTKTVDLEGKETGFFYNIHQKTGEIKTNGYLTFPHTSSFVFINPMYDQGNEKRIEYFKKVTGWDKTFAIFFLSQGKIFYFSDCMSCYRIDLKKGSSYMAIEAQNNIIDAKLKIEKELKNQIEAYGLRLDISKHHYYNVIIYELLFLFRQPNRDNFEGLKKGWKDTPHKVKCISFIIAYFLKRMINKVRGR